MTEHVHVQPQQLDLSSFTIRLMQGDGPSRLTSVTTVRPWVLELSTGAFPSLQEP